jgi:hypothetical protein
MTPEERVRRFLDAMTAWELRAEPIIVAGLGRADFDGSPELASEVRSLEAIWSEHLTDKGRSAARFGRRLDNRRRIPVVQRPAQYDHDVLRTEDGAKKSTCYVVTKSRWNPLEEFRFTIAVVKGEPRIDDLKRRVPPTGDWLKASY